MLSGPDAVQRALADASYELSRVRSYFLADYDADAGEDAGYGARAGKLADAVRELARDIAGA